MGITENWSPARMKICEPDCRQASLHPPKRRSRAGMTVKGQINIYI